MANKCPKCQTNNPDDVKFCGECGAPLDADVIRTRTLNIPIPELTIGSTFAERYQVIEELGKGGMGQVYKVLDLETQEKIALKLINPEIALDKKTIERFRNELITARKIVHKNVCQMYDLNKYENNYYITMELVSGGDLKRLIRRTKRLDIGTAISTTKQICIGLEEAHSLGIVHRDLKPANIMIDLLGDAKIMDFGIAQTVKGKGLTGSGVMIGTPEYMSPEQVEAKGVDQRSDIYSLGIILYEMVTGQVPYTAETPLSIGVKHKSETPQDPRELNIQISDDLARIIYKCLAKERASRYQSVKEVHSELQVLESSFPKIERESTKRKAATSKEMAVQVNRTKLIIPALALIAVLVIVSFLLFKKRQNLLNIRIDLTQQITRKKGLEVDPAISPDGKMIAYAAGVEGRMRIFVRQIAGGRTIALTETLPGRHRSPQWSPDGTRIAFLSGEEIFIIPALGGIPKRIVGIPKTVTYIWDKALRGPPVWSPDSEEIAYPQGNTIFRISTSGGEPSKISDAHEPHSLCWSPDGRYIAFVSGNSEFVFGSSEVGSPIIGNLAPSSIWIVSPTKGNPIQVAEATNLNMSPVWLPDSRQFLFVSNRGGSRDIYQLRIDPNGNPQNAPIRLTTGLDAHTISISSDASKLVYSVYHNYTNIWSIRIPEKEAISITEARPVTEGNQTIEGLDVSPDGQWLAFDSNRNGNQDIFKMPVAGGEPIQLTTNPSDDFMPSWSPDGKEIAFYSFRTGNRDIHIMNSEGSSIQQVTTDPAHERYPDWSPGALYYLKKRQGFSMGQIPAAYNRGRIPMQMVS